MHPLSFYVKYIFFNHFLQVSPYVKTKWHSYLMEVVSNLNQITLPYISLWKKYYFRSYLHLLISPAHKPKKNRLRKNQGDTFYCLISEF